MDSNNGKINKIEKTIAIVFLAIVFLFIPYKILLSGFMPIDDTNRHVAFSVTDQIWTDVLEIEPSLASDHNAGLHYILRFVHKNFGFDKKDLLVLSVVGFFFLFNITGILISPNVGVWGIVILIMFVFERGLLFRLLSGRPFILSCAITLVLFKLWFINSKNQVLFYTKYLVTILLLILAVWIHGTWYTFLLLPISLLLAGQIGNCIGLLFCIIVSTFLGACLTGEFSEFLHYHYAATLNIFSEKIYNWQLVTEFAEGNIHSFWIIPTLFIIIFLVYSKKFKLRELGNDGIFICILLCWLLSIRVVRFWVDWGAIALTFWLSLKISKLVEDMQSIKKPFFRWVLFLFTLFAIVLLIPDSGWNNQKARADYSVDFSNSKYSEFKPEEGGIIYNDAMKHFYFLYYAIPDGKFKYVLGFEPAIMFPTDRKVFRDIIYSEFNFKSYKPWIDKLTKKDRIFASVDLRDYYPQLDWIKAGKHLYIGKIK